MLTKEWIEYEIAALGRERDTAERQLEEARRKMNNAVSEYDAIRKSVETLKGCIRGLTDELRFMDKVEEAAG
ncbi:MAG: hypothetical protein LBK02_07605 [Treponema sp.]|jgi:predicted  nucleic acid-binding Zn-ribbon protein|nr:hypothetical protein [Treponema sp.]